MFFGRALKVDVSESKIEEISLDDSLYSEKIGGAAIIASLIDDAKEDCIAFGVGPLTGAPCPAGSAAIACVADKNGRRKFAPILLNGGVELRLTGFDFVIVSGVSAEPIYLWIRDMTADIVKMPADSNWDCWETCQRIRKDQGDPRIQVISCSEGDSASLNFTSGWDGIGLGGRMRNMNLMAMAFRGMADIELSRPDAFLEKSSAMMRSFPSSLDGKTGLPSLIGNLMGNLAGLKRSRACFSCPFPCLSYADSGNPSFPQFLVLDQTSFYSLHKQGVSSDAILKQLASDHRAGNAKPRSVKMFDTITEQVVESEQLAAAYILGLCPRYISLFNPGLEQYCALLSIGLGREITERQVIQIAEALSRS
ncbi:MAG: aldehyde ferredoxin oxidoreductase N-terminal domain-containing protein [Thermoplasmata archaeon]